ncbi:hypothetical protein KCP75_19455 [Salmonella enterica subsp. enterica]|nr:hypothetical protein KCP75_19455 [Salmonella enterica subsp. enterica]
MSGEPSQTGHWRASRAARSGSVLSIANNRVGVPSAGIYRYRIKSPSLNKRHCGGAPSGFNDNIWLSFMALEGCQQSLVNMER